MEASQTTGTVLISSHDRILNAAKSLFARQGYEETSTAAIARLARSSESQLIKHFGSKEGLLNALFDEGWKIFKEGLTAISRLDAPKRKLYALVNLMVSALPADNDLKVIMLLESGRMHTGHVASMSNNTLQLIQMMDSILREMRTAGDLKPGVHIAAMRSAILGMLAGLLRAQIVSKQIGYPANYSLREMKQTLEMAMSGFIADGR